MKYRTDKYGNEISILGYGCMRFSSNGTKIDVDKAEKEIMEAYNSGVNYYDTAYVYDGSEETLGEIVRRNGIRDKIKIATKLPHYMVKKPEHMDKYFEESLRRLGTDYIDYYLIHLLSDIKSFERLCELGLKEWIIQKKTEGKIRQIGFSYHGNSDMFLKLLDAYDWDFCQIQYNYMDEHSQAGRTGLEAAEKKGIPVVIMEPLRGGKLSRLSDKALKIMNAYDTKRSPVQWALKWLWNQSGVTCVLSGMNDMEQVKDNCANASESEAGCLSEADNEMLHNVAVAINSEMKVGCTGCRYCMPCPNGVDIPGAFSAYNRIYSENYRSAFIEHFMCSAIRHDTTAAELCIECGKCEQHCPQGIEIRKELKNVKKKLENPIYRIGRWFATKVLKY